MTDQTKPLKYSLESLPELLGEHDFRMLVHAVHNGTSDDTFGSLMLGEGDTGANFHTLVRIASKRTEKKQGD